MVIFTPKEAVEIFGGNEGKQILSFITNQGYTAKEYLSQDGVWSDIAGNNTRGVRYCLDDRSRLDDVAGIWRLIKERSSANPEKPDKILERLVRARFGSEKLKIFSPWGPRYRNGSPKIEDSDPEMATLKEVRDVFQQFNARGYSPDFLLMPADVYGTELNSLGTEFVADYFKSLEERTRETLGGLANITIKPWSAIRSENSQSYEALKTETERRFQELVKAGEFEKAIKVAAIFNNDDVEERARKYCTERIVEGEIIGRVYNPLKLSLVRKEKDALDGPLERIYVIQNKGPWLMGGNQDEC